MCARAHRYVDMVYIHTDFFKVFFLEYCTNLLWDFPDGEVVKNLPAMQASQGSIPGWGKSPGIGNWQPTPVFLLGEFHGQRSLAGYSPLGPEELDTTE